MPPATTQSRRDPPLAVAQEPSRASRRPPARRGKNIAALPPCKRPIPRKPMPTDPTVAARTGPPSRQEKKQETRALRKTNSRTQCCVQRKQPERKAEIAVAGKPVKSPHAAS